MFQSNLSDHERLRVAAYCRVSTDQQDQLNSLTSQQNYFEQYILSQKDWQLSHIYYDEGISGTQTQKRAGFNAMIESARRGEMDLILTKEVSRFARNTVDALSYTRQLKDLGVGVLFTLDHIDTRDSDGELRLTLMAGIAQEESRKTSERVKWGQTRRMEQGIVFGRDLLGYRVKDGTLSVNEPEAAVVRFIFEQYTYAHKSTSAIAMELTAQKIPPKQSSIWSPSVIYRILQNEKYVGDLCQKKSYTPNYLTHKKIRNSDPATQIYLRDHHVPIINRDLWERTQKERKLRSRYSAVKTKYSSRYWCSGRIQCGLCGQNFVSRTKKRKDGTIYQAWRCRNAACHGRLRQTKDETTYGCNNISINDQTLRASVQYVCDLCRISGDFPHTSVPIDFIRIFPDHTLILQLKNAPCAYHLTIRTRGRLATYTTEILQCERIERIE